MDDQSHAVMRQLERVWTARGLTRRDFLRLAGMGVSLTAIAGILAACADTPPAPVAPRVPTAPPSTMPSPSVVPSGATIVPSVPQAPATPTTALITRTVGTPMANTMRLEYPSGGPFSTIEPVGRKGGGVVEVAFADAKTNNPLLTTDLASNYRIGLQYLSLLGLNPDTALPYPDLAAAVPTRENGGIAADGRTYTFQLRTDVRWSDGTPFTANDVVFTYQTLARKDLGSPRTAEINDRVASVSNPDDYTVVFKLNKIVAPFLTANCTGAGYGIVPAHILKGVPVGQIKQHPFSAGDPRFSVATGPFIFQEWVKDDHATLVKNDTFFRGEPALDRYDFRVVRDSTAVVASLKTGESDWGQVALSFYDEITKQRDLATTKYDTYSFEFAGFQLDPVRTTLFQDTGVRQALAYALDREAMARAIYGGLAVVAQGTAPTLSFAYAPDQMQKVYGYDPKRAEALLEEAGWRKGSDGIRIKDGKKLQFTIWTNAGSTSRESLVTVMQEQWKAIGVDATPKTEEWSALLARVTETQEFEMFVIGFAWDVDPDQTQMWSSRSFPPNGFNLGKYANPQVDMLLDQGLTELDPAKRKAIYIELQNHLLADVPAIILVFPQGVAAVNTRLHNCKPNAVGLSPRWNTHLWWVDDGK
ncbi:MAG TPA: ABC transporter substrate-binding protein [Thermomicrobiales bacterium]